MRATWHVRTFDFGEHQQHESRFDISVSTCGRASTCGKRWATTHTQRRTCTHTCNMYDDDCVCRTSAVGETWLRESTHNFRPHSGRTSTRSTRGECTALLLARFKACILNSGTRGRDTRTCGRRLQELQMVREYIPDFLSDLPHRPRTDFALLYISPSYIAEEKTVSGDGASR